MANAPAASATSQQQQSVPDQHPSNAYSWLLAWGVLLLVLYGINKTRIGHVVVYYTLVLMIVFLLVTQYHAIAAVLLPFSKLNAGFAPDGSTSTSDATTQHSNTHPGQQVPVHERPTADVVPTQNTQGVPTTSAAGAASLGTFIGAVVDPTATV